MEVTPLGCIFIPISVVLFYIRPSYLYYLMIFSMGFSATSVINFGSGASASGLQASMLFGAMWAGNMFVGVIHTGKIRVPKQQVVLDACLLLFLLIAMASLAMPALLEGRMLISNPEIVGPFDSVTVISTIQLSPRHLTQLIYLIYGVLIALLIAIKNREYECFVKTVRSYVLSSVFISCWGIFQWGLTLFDYPYPYWLFNNSPNPSAQGFIQEFIDLDLSRICSVAVEPSILAQQLLTAMPFLLFVVSSKHKIISNRFDTVSIIIMTITLLLTTSTTALAGLVITLVLFGIITLVARPINAGSIFILGIMAVTGAVYLSSPDYSEIFSRVVIDKADSGSAVERFESVASSWDYFTSYPVLGVGWGSLSTHDLIVKILASTGIAGFCAFGAFSLAVLYQLFNTMKYYCADKKLIMESYVSACFACFVCVLIVSMFVGFSFQFGYPWFIIGMSIAATTAIASEITQGGGAIECCKRDHSYL